MQALDAAKIREELELEREWRDDELRFLENQGAHLVGADLAKFRRSVVLLIYAHMEGFCKFALTAYAAHVNAAGCLVKETEWAIAAASLAKVFSRFRDNDLKSDLFRRILPQDAKLHRFCRERDLLEQLEEFERQLACIQIDDVVDMESNLTDAVLRKVLYRLGLPIDVADKFQAEIRKLLALRNNIAHGAMRDGVKDELYLELRRASAAVCDELTKAVFEAARRGAHLRQPAVSP